jgi:hypothetical protein
MTLDDLFFSHNNTWTGNYRHCITDCEAAIKYKPENAKAFYRAALAARKLDKLDQVRFAHVLLCKVVVLHLTTLGYVQALEFGKKGQACGWKSTSEIKELNQLVKEVCMFVVGF